MEASGLELCIAVGKSWDAEVDGSVHLRAAEAWASQF